MKKLFYSLAGAVIAGMVFVTGCGAAKQVADESVDMRVRQIDFSPASSVSQMLSQAKSAVVGISASYADGYAIGTGVAISDGGLILTNNHVVEGGGKLTLYFADKTTGSGKLLWSNAGIDLAVIQSSREIPYLSVSTAELGLGEPVYAIGTPLTLEFKHTLTHGIVSAVNRTLESETSEGTAFLQSLIQHDAPINPGNSGGPLINENGQVVGINTLKATEGEGIGFAIPIEIGSIVVENIKRDPSYKEAYLGVFGFDSDIARVYGESLSADGVYVVSTDGPAKSAGIQKGDLIVELGGEKISTLLSLRKAVLKKVKGDSVSVKYIRSGVEKQALVTLK